MTVKELNKTLDKEFKLAICWENVCFNVDRDNEFLCDAFGNYVVRNIRVYTEDTIEIAIAVTPLKA